MTAYRRCRDVAVVGKEGVDEVYVAHVPDGPVLSLLGTGGIIWRLLADGLQIGEIIAALYEGTGAPVEEVEPAVRDFIADLVSQGLIEAVPQGEPAPRTTRGHNGQHV